MKVDGKHITLEGILRLVGDELELFFPLTKRQAYRNFYNPKFIFWKDYFPSVVKKKINKLEREGLVEKKEVEGGWVVTITNKGKKQVLNYDLLNLTPKTGKWDGKWRLVFFDILELDRKKRDMLRWHLRRLGMKPMQESVFVGPFDVEKEVQFVREVLEIPHGVKLGVMERLENDRDLRDIFDL